MKRKSTKTPLSGASVAQAGSALVTAASTQLSRQPSDKMRHAQGDIWTWFDHGIPIVIPTNIGWKQDGSNVMGRGLAVQASRRYPNLAKEYGQICKAQGSGTKVHCWTVRQGDSYYSLILFPVKPLNKKAPYLSWDQDADLDLIRRSARELALLPETAPEYLPKGYFAKVAIPLVGCGNGGLNCKDVLPILKAELDSRFVLVEWEG